MRIRVGLFECLLGSVVVAMLAAWLSLWVGYGWIAAIVVYVVVASGLLLVSTIVLVPGRDRRGVKPARFRKEIVA